MSEILTDENGLNFAEFLERDFIMNPLSCIDVISSDLTVGVLRYIELDPNNYYDKSSFHATYENISIDIAFLWRNIHSVCTFVRGREHWTLNLVSPSECEHHTAYLNLIKRAGKCTITSNATGEGVVEGGG